MYKNFPMYYTKLLLVFFHKLIIFLKFLYNWHSLYNLFKNNNTKYNFLKLICPISSTILHNNNNIIMTIMVSRSRNIDTES